MNCVDLVNGRTEVYGIIGNPVEKSFSPVLQNTIAKELGKNIAYVPFKVDRGEVKTAVSGGQALGIKGFNVTVPHKIEVMESLCEIDKTAERIGAVNTLKLTQNGYKGYNTDIIGLKKTFQERNISIEGKTVILAGAGGAANSAAMLAGEEKAKKLVIVNRTSEKAELLAQRVRQYYSLTVETVSYEDIMTVCDPEIFVQTTSVGMGNDAENTPIKNTEFFNNVKFAVDIIYTPWETKLMKDAVRRGVQTVNGFDMLFYQGLASFEIWHDMSVDFNTAVMLKEKLTNFYRRG
ncbi:MAG: shikimate dehydrogenase [Candidatus Metalachnospira sp.]|nr:shikimate dehydrogenase [Candidatus Metalachnospira sp.]